MSTSSSDRFVAGLDALGADDLARAGGKAANLGELIRAGHRVPRGFVVTTDAYETVVTRSGLRSRIYDLRDSGAPGVPEKSAAALLRSHLAEVDVPREMRVAIVAAYADQGGGPVAVRSSATAEDLPGAAFAGQQDTYLNVVGSDAVVAAVRRCWASLWTDRAIAYRRRRGIDHTTARMAVVVQELIEPDTAGVLLTANPVTGARDELVIEASSGLGEAVVSGLVTPDHYVLDRRGRLREWTPGTREVVVRSAPGGGVVHDRAASAPHERLPAAVLAELADIGAGVAQHFGRPQDVEWAYADGRCWLLQARPMTALPPPPLELNRIRRVIGLQLVEMLPVRPYPLDMTAWLVPGLGRMVTRMLAEIPGLRVDFSAILPEVDGVVDRLVPPMPRPTAAMATAPVRNLPRIRRYDPASWTSDPRFAEFERRVRALAAQDPATLPWVELCQVPRRALDVLDVITDLRVDYLPRGGASLLRLRLVLKLLGSSELFPSLIAGAPTRTAAANRSLAVLAGHVRRDEALRRLFVDLDGEELADRILHEPRFHSFRAAVDDLLHEYGHRETTSPLLVSSPTWSDAPATVLGAVKALYEEPAGPRPADRSEDARQRLLDHPIVRRTGSRARLRRTVEAARAAIAFREDSHFHGTRLLPILRGTLLEIGQRLTDAGMLRDGFEVFHLRLAELEGLGDPGAASDAEAESVRRVVLRRAARRDELSVVPLIAPATLFPTASDDAGALVSGTPASGGRATGPVRVIVDPSGFGQLRSGDVLVCAYTNPAWTPLFQRAAAVVADTGGPSSHAAIVAREYGIPAVMGTGTGTRTLTDGQVVTVDGDRGRVTAARDSGGST